MNIELVQDVRAMIGEGPIWDERTGRLHWVDIAAGIVHRFAPADGSDRFIDVGQPVGSLGLGALGGLVVSIRDGFGLLPAGTDHLERVVEVEKGIEGNRMNDGRCDSLGRFWAGTMAWDHAPGAGALYRFEQESQSLVATKVLGDLTIANGIDWSPDGATMYYIDSTTQRIDAFDFDAASGTVSNRRPFAMIASTDGMPDGLVVDADGAVWVALFGAGRIRRYLPKGAIDREIVLPVSLVTSMAFGGPDLADLFVTTARHRLAPNAHEVHAGSLFACRPGPTGRPSERFRWI